MTRLALLLLLTLPAGLHAPGVSVARPEPRVWRPEPVERGIASWYGAPFHGRTAADGSRFDMFAMTAASRTLPLGTVCEIVCQATGRAVVVRICDRGPFIAGRILDLSYAAMAALGGVEDGLKQVEVFIAKNTKEEL